MRKGFLKHNLYCRVRNFVPEKDSDFLTFGDLDRLVEAYRNCFDIALSAGTPFHSKIVDGVEYWGDEKGWTERLTNEWAEKYLEDIQ